MSYKNHITSTNLEINHLNLMMYLYEGFANEKNDNNESHFHSQCEIYVNISGNVSFMVENRIYAIESGDVIITRPYEKHHCIYHSKENHNHFCMRFTYEGNEEILGSFFDRNAGEGNLISLLKHDKEKLISTCKTLVDTKDTIKKHIAFFTLIDIISNGSFSAKYDELSGDLKLAVDYINSNFTKQITLDEIAQNSHMTINTLERHFRLKIGISPYSYIQNCRFSNAIAILETGGTVTDAAMESGFSDYSHFIASFKKRYGKTPLKFKQGLMKQQIF